MKLHVIGTNFKHTSLENVARVHWPVDRSPWAFLSQARQTFSLGEIFFLQTCNRREFYFHAPCELAETDAFVDSFLAAVSHSIGNELEPAHFYHFQDRDAVYHFFKVASSLDSMVLGETEIIKQIKDQSAEARERGLVGARLKALVDAGLWASKQVRHQTKITQNVVSMASLAFRSIKRRVAGNANRRVVFVGAGHFIQSLMPTFAKAEDLEFLFVNRSKPDDLARQYGGTAMSLADFQADPPAFGAMISATSAPGVLFEPSWLKRHGAHALLLDAALPADMDPDGHHLERGLYHGLAEMEAILAENRAAREAEIPKAEPLFAEGAARLETRWLEFDLATYNQEISAHFRKTGERALNHLLKDMNQPLCEEDRTALRDWTHNLMNRLTKVPILGLKGVARELGQEGLEAYTRGVSARSTLFKQPESP